jgi:hypothetical protein
MENKNSNQIPEDIKELVIARLDNFPSGKRVSIGSKGEFSKDDLIEHVKEGDDIGKTMVAIEYEYIEALKNGTLLREMATLPE